MQMYFEQHVCKEKACRIMHKGAIYGTFLQFCKLMREMLTNMPSLIYLQRHSVRCRGDLVRRRDLVLASALTAIHKYGARLISRDISLFSVWIHQCQKLIQFSSTVI